MTVLMSLVCISSLVAWFVGLDTLPATIRVATGEKGGLYFRVGKSMESSLKQRIRHRISVDSTRGSQENFERLIRGDAQLAVVQGGAVPLEQVSVVTPLFPELVFVIARKGTNVMNVADLSGKKVALGPTGSGNRASALKVLKHFGMESTDLTSTNDYFKTLLDDATLDAAIVTAGIEHPDLHQVLATNRFQLIPIRSAKAIDMVNPFLKSSQIPRGLFAEQPPVPSEAIPTIATTAFLVVRNDASDRLVQAALATIHEESLRLHVPTLIPRKTATDWMSTRFHPVAHRYFNPSDNIGQMANIMESLAATKELLFAIGAGVYILWIRWKRLKDMESQELLSRQKEHLDDLLEETLRIEKLQMETNDADELREFLEQVTQIKLKALYEFTEEELRSDQAFTIFLDQCTAVIGRIQLKMISDSTVSEA